MKFVIQRVDQASVSVDEKVIGSIGQGYVILVGVSNTDTKEIADRMLKKTLGLRLFSDENGKTNLSLSQVGGELLIISQFTLYANCRKGNRPSFTEAGGAELAEELYQYILEQAKKECDRVESGEFGAHMSVSLTNNGPFTILLDSDQILK
ncbi:MAG: D-tyrosyl-tRNA(Tyr) deacylase [Lachnospiraceae bacterium]|nr:D-tyrosyl-tRNA(Tyr) deacylase [Lachnospiraceae bacterium]